MATTRLAFTNDLLSLKTAIDTELQDHSRQLLQTTTQKFTRYSTASVSAYTNILARGGKRIRGALTIVGYRMVGGKNEAMILQAACAIEMVHAYILVLDDIMDKSLTRRGGESAHAALATYHRQRELSGESIHFGEAIAINAALIGNHYAQSIITELDTKDSYKIHALKLLNDALVVTGHGQINDVFNEAVRTVTQDQVDKVLEWKTAVYTFLNPLQFGMVLGGASSKELEGLTEYCMHAGRAFQITDDIIGTFASQQEAGKSPMDDIREGKRTVLSVTALERANPTEKLFLLKMLGNGDLSEEEFDRCKNLFEQYGAREDATQLAGKHIAQAKSTLNKNKHLWQQQGVDFLLALADSLQGRTT